MCEYIFYCKTVYINTPFLFAFIISFFLFSFSLTFSFYIVFFCLEFVGFLFFFYSAFLHFFPKLRRSAFLTQF